MNKYLFILSIGLSYAAIFLTPSSVSAQNMALEWAKKIGGALTTDNMDNLYLVGSFSDTTDFDPGPGIYNLVAQGSSDIYVLKLTGAGDFVWAKQMGSPTSTSLESAYSVAVDTLGNVLVVGRFFDTADFDPGPGTYNLVSNGGSDAFVVKLDSSGSFIWATSWGGNSNDDVNKVHTDDSGNVYISGTFKGSADFDPGPGISILVGAHDVYVLKLATDGTFAWAAQAFVSGIIAARDMVVDAAGNTYVVGKKTISAPVGAAWQGSGGTVFAWKLDGLGNQIWHYQFDDDPRPTDNATAMALDPNGYLYICGYFQDEMDADPGPAFDTLTALGIRDIFVLKLDTAANVMWVKRIGNSGSEEAEDIAIDASGNIYVTGSFYGSFENGINPYTTDFDPGSGEANITTIGPGNRGDVFLLKLDSSGQYQWAYSIGSEGRDVGYQVHVGVHGVVYTSGSFGQLYNVVGTAVADFDPGPGVVNLVTQEQELFIQKLRCNDTTSFLIADTACDSYTLNGAVYTEAGTYTQVRPNAAGCDSVIILELTISEPEAIITVDGFTLSTTLSYTTYQWFLNGTLISGATQAIYMVTENGDYTVAVTNEHGCADTSEIYTVTNVTGIGDLELSRQLRVFPNPAHTQVSIESTSGLRIAGIRIFNVLGAEVYHAAGNGSTEQSLDIRQLANGMYLLHIETDKGVAIQKLDIIR